MSLVYLLDALDPGSPAELLAAIAAAKVDGAGGYVYRGGGSIGGWTPAHFEVLRQAGHYLYPLAVPLGDGSTSPTPWPAITAAAQAFGFVPGDPLVIDMERPGNLPPPSWWSNFLAAAPEWELLKYGNNGDVGAYARGAGWLEAFYVQLTVEPRPTALPAGVVGWQYAHEVPINGRLWDVNAIDEEVLLNVTQLGDIWTTLTEEKPPGSPDPPTVRQMLRVLFNQDAPGGATQTELDAIRAAIAALPSGDAGGWTPAQQAEIDNVLAAVDRIEAGLKGA